MKARSERTQVTQDYVLTTIVETVERCRQSVRPKFNGQDQAIVETPNGEGLAFVFDAGSVLKGAELLGRHLKMFTDKVEQSGPGGGPMEHVTRIELVPAGSVHKAG
jgi:phage terminase small subunit